jgi:hypothetical protein
MTKDEREKLIEKQKQALVTAQQCNLQGLRTIEQQLRVKIDNAEQALAQGGEK